METRPDPIYRFLLGAGLVLVTVLALGGVCSNEFVNYDDDVYVTQNFSVLYGIDLLDLGWPFTATRSNHWHPLTWISLQLDADLFGAGPWGFHFTNLILHIANVLLLFALLVRMTANAGRGAVVAGLFAVHPLHVESVAWVTERKDVLSTFFWLLTTMIYVEYARSPSRRRYGWLLVIYALGLLAKPMLLTLPCTLLLLDYWPLRRMVWSGATNLELGTCVKKSSRELVWEKLPLFILGILSGIISLAARRHGGGLKSGEYLDLWERLGYALTASTAYLGKTLWPVGLAPIYPLTPGGLPAGQIAASVLILIGLSSGFLVSARRRPYLAVGWLWYLGTLVPVSGIVQLGSYAMADRYTYVPSIGLFVMIVWGCADLASETVRVRVLAPAATIILFGFALMSRQQVRYWHDSVALWQHTLEVTPDNFVVRMLLGNAEVERDHLDAAEAEYDAASRRLSGKPGSRQTSFLANAYARIGQLRSRRGALTEAIACFRKALELDPGNPRLQASLNDLMKKKTEEE